MTSKNLLVVVVLLSAVLGVDAKAAGRSPRKTEKLYRKAGKWQRKLRDVWALLGVKPFLVQPGEKGDECVLKSEITVDDATDKNDYMPKSTVEAEYVLKGADVFTQADVDAARQEGIASVTPEDGVTQADVDEAIEQTCTGAGGTFLSAGGYHMCTPVFSSSCTPARGRCCYGQVPPYQGDVGAGARLCYN